ncbi:hypothetical protein D770_15970 [Flammeovirgaceae bacterium 311]|nr:hypothetical protein D770_15970 [Flammeovirgaceae bacterium 311]
MKIKQLYFTAAFMLLTGITWAQPEPIKWGKVDQQDLEMKIYENDTTAQAVILGDYGEAYFTYNEERGFQLNIKRHVRIKILKTGGLEWANVEHLLYHNSSKVKEEMLAVKGTTFNLVNGKEEKSKLSKSDVFVEAYNERANLHKFTMPNVKVGSVIEYEYHKLSDFIYSFETWVFQSTIPTRWSEFRAKVPEYFSYKNFMSGHYAPHINESETYQDRFTYTVTYNGAGGSGIPKKEQQAVTPNGMKYRWVMKDVPALKEEAYITTLSDYASKLEFELNYTRFPQQPIKQFSSDWDKLSKGFLEANRFGGELKKQKHVSELVASLTAGKQKPEEKMLALYAFIQQNIKYNGQERVYMTKGFKEVVAKKEGNAAEINLLLTAMLREAGLQANPVIMSTRRHGRINPIIPLEKDFNYVICHVNMGENQYLLLDATDPFQPLGTLPYRCMNDRGRLVADDYTSWVTLLNKEKNSSFLKANLKVMPNGTMAGTLTYMLDGYEAVNVRKKMFSDGEAKYLEKFSGNKANWLVKEYKVDNFKNVYEKLEEHFTLEIMNKATPAGNKLYVSLLPEGVDENSPFKMDDRKFPVNFGCPTENMLMYEIELPAGYVVEQLPEPAMMVLPDKSAVFRFNVAQLGNKLSVTSTLQIKKPVYTAEDYGALKQFYQLMLAKQNEQVVLTKQN